MTEPKTQQKPALDEIVKIFNSQLESYGYGRILELAVTVGWAGDNIVTYRDALAHQLSLR